MPMMTLSLTTAARGAGLALAGIAVLHRPDDLAGLGVERDQRGVGLMQEDLAVAIATPRLTVSQHITGMTFGSCFGSYFHDLVLVVQIERVDLVRERRVDVHHVRR
jgi:hypothetical protein